MIHPCPCLLIWSFIQSHLKWSLKYVTKSKAPGFFCGWKREGDKNASWAGGFDWHKKFSIFGVFIQNSLFFFVQFRLFMRLHSCCCTIVYSIRRRWIQKNANFVFRRTDLETTSKGPRQMPRSAVFCRHHFISFTLSCFFLFGHQFACK